MNTWTELPKLPEIGRKVLIKAKPNTGTYCLLDHYTTDPIGIGFLEIISGRPDASNTWKVWMWNSFSKSYEGGNGVADKHIHSWRYLDEI